VKLTRLLIAQTILTACGSGSLTPSLGLAWTRWLQPCDFLTDELGAGFDVALVINIVHGLSEDENRRLIGRVSAALNPGGRIVLLEQFAGRAPGPAVYAINRLLDLTYHLVLKGRTYRFADAVGWLTDAGFGIGWPARAGSGTASLPYCRVSSHMESPRCKDPDRRFGRRGGLVQTAAAVSRQPWHM